MNKKGLTLPCRGNLTDIKYLAPSYIRCTSICTSSTLESYKLSNDEAMVEESEIQRSWWGADPHNSILSHTFGSTPENPPYVQRINPHPNLN